MVVLGQILILGELVETNRADAWMRSPLLPVSITRP